MVNIRDPLITHTLVATPSSPRFLYPRIHQSPLDSPSRLSAGPDAAKKTHEKEQQTNLGGGFKPFAKYESNWIISPGKDTTKKIEIIASRLYITTAFTDCWHKTRCELPETLSKDRETQSKAKVQMKNC